MLCISTATICSFSIIDIIDIMKIKDRFLLLLAASLAIDIPF